MGFLVYTIISNFVELICFILKANKLFADLLNNNSVNSQIPLRFTQPFARVLPNKNRRTPKLISNPFDVNLNFSVC